MPRTGGSSSGYLWWWGEEGFNAGIIYKIRVLKHADLISECITRYTRINI